MWHLIDKRAQLDMQSTNGLAHFSNQIIPGDVITFLLPGIQLEILSRLYFLNLKFFKVFYLG